MKKTEEIKKIFDMFLNSLNHHVNKIKNEIVEIGEIVDKYEKVKESFNSKNFDIQKYIDEFLESIKSHTEFITGENKKVNSEIKKNETNEIKLKDYVPNPENEDPVITKESIKEIAEMLKKELFQSGTIIPKNTTVIKSSPEEKIEPLLPDDPANGRIRRKEVQPKVVTSNAGIKILDKNGQPVKLRERENISVDKGIINSFEQQVKIYEELDRKQAKEDDNFYEQPLV
jgi:hypothetical protein